MAVKLMKWGLVKERRELTGISVVLKLGVATLLKVNKCPKRVAKF
jgi:hypothetical protein